MSTAQLLVFNDATKSLLSVLRLYTMTRFISVSFSLEDLKTFLQQISATHPEAQSINIPTSDQVFSVGSTHSTKSAASSRESVRSTPYKQTVASRCHVQACCFLKHSFPLVVSKKWFNISISFSQNQHMEVANGVEMTGSSDARSKSWLCRRDLRVEQTLSLLLNKCLTR